MKNHTEKIKLLIMRDSGKVRTVTLSRSLFSFLIFIGVLLPFALGGAVWFGIEIWQMHRELTVQCHAMQQEYQEAKALTARIADLERLLQYTDTKNNAQVLQNIRRADTPALPEAAPSQVPAQESAVQTEGPGHPEFPAINTGKIRVDNTTVRFIQGQGQGRQLRISLDLTNPDPTTIVGGKIVCILTTADGQTLPLRLFPQGAEAFRIAQLRRVVLTAQLPPNSNPTDAQVVVEIKQEGGDTILYRTVHAVAR